MHLLVGLVNYSHNSELLSTVQVSPLKWFFTPGQDSRDMICRIAIRRLYIGELEGALSLSSSYIYTYVYKLYIL